MTPSYLFVGLAFAVAIRIAQARSWRLPFRLAGAAAVLAASMAIAVSVRPGFLDSEPWYLRSPYSHTWVYLSTLAGMVARYILSAWSEVESGATWRAALSGYEFFRSIVLSIFTFGVVLHLTDINHLAAETLILAFENGFLSHSVLEHWPGVPRPKGPSGPPSGHP